MSGPFARAVYPLRRLSHLADLQLGKMLQPAQLSRSDLEVPYMRAGHLTSLPEELPTMWASPMDMRRYTVLAGDLLVAEGGDVGRAQFTPAPADGVVIQNSLHRLRVVGDHDIRFLRYGLVAVYFSDWLEVLCNKSTFGHLTAEKLGALQIPAPSIAVQRAIADFLDTETTRIDALLTKKRRMIELLTEKRRRTLESVLREHEVLLPPSTQPGVLSSIRLPPGWRIIRLGATLRQLTNGYVGPTRDILRDEGVRYIQGLHLKNGRIDFNRRPYYVSEAWHEARPRTSLHGGDVLIVQTGDIGQCAVVQDDFGEANCHALLIARPNSTVIRPEYLGAYLQSDFGYRSLVRVATGALHPHLEFGIRDVPLVVPPIEIQRNITDAVRRSIDQVDSIVGRLVTQLERIREHRQALITAAVTGELDIPGAAA